MGRSAPAALFYKLVGCRLLSVCANDRHGERRVGRLGVTRPPHLQTKRSTYKKALARPQNEPVARVFNKAKE